MKLLKKLQDNFTIIDNEVLKIKTLSMKAKGLYCILISLPSDWNFSVEGLATLSSDGKDSTRNAVIELENHNLLKRERIKNEKGFFDMIYKIFDTTTFENSPTETPLAENPPKENLQDNKERNNKERNNKEYMYIKGSEKFYKKFQHLSLSENEFEKLLKDGYEKEEIDELLDEIANYKKNTKYRSLYLTIRSWSRKRKRDEKIIQNKFFNSQKQQMACEDRKNFTF